MSKKKQLWSRRDFLITAGVAGAGSILTPSNRPLEASGELQKMPMRPFGKTGLHVPILSFGGSLDTSMTTLLLKQAVRWGATYWDTAHSYMGGRSEKGMGKYLEKY
ncbi:MAG: twin-arginine translocation signal domain-containing protein, partial [Deltaproteobacteria bacterium]|nr:twin-arginine translocation signal domain-containing protein [Deltaproteobacteria bacterium]